MHVNVDDPDVELEFRQGGEEWQGVCKPPCDQELTVPQGRFYRFSGDGVRASRSFSMDPLATTADFDVSPGYTWMFGTGIAAITVGALALVGGMGLFFLEGLESLGCNVACDKTELYGGLGIAGGGVALALGAGLPLMLLSRTTFDSRYGQSAFRFTADGMAVSF